jgi:chemotaxis protein methyltransferase CheR
VLKFKRGREPTPGFSGIRGDHLDTQTLLRPISLTESDLKLVQALVYQECGMFFDERRSHFLRDRIQRRLKSTHFESFYSYYQLLTSSDGKKELAALVENLTVNETSFFRIRPQLDLFQKKILEELLNRKRERRDWSLRIWSAGCSTGQEPYTLAIMVCDALAYYYLRHPLPFDMPSPKPMVPPPWKVEIIATAHCSPPDRVFTPNRRWSRWITIAGCATSIGLATSTP